MRLIDADAIPWTDLNADLPTDIKVLITFADKVNRMPTIEERKKGYWIYSTCDGEMIEHQCSVCKRHAGYSLKWMRWYNFCPWCGADMRGGKDGETESN